MKVKSWSALLARNIKAVAGGLSQMQGTLWHLFHWNTLRNSWKYCWTILSHLWEYDEVREGERRWWEVVMKYINVKPRSDPEMSRPRPFLTVTGWRKHYSTWIRSLWKEVAVRGNISWCILNWTACLDVKKVDLFKQLDIKAQNLKTRWLVVRSVVTRCEIWVLHYSWVFQKRDIWHTLC